jgi:glutamine cyclotransferase
LKEKPIMKHLPAEIIREFGPFPGVEAIHGVSYDGQLIWFASGDLMNALDPQSGEITRTIEVPAHAGTAFDGTHLFQIGEAVIRKVDPATGKVVGTIPAPGGSGDSGLTWAEGSLWVGEFRDRKIHQIDPETGRILRTILSDRFVTGVSWVNGELWHGTWEDNTSEVRRIDPETGEVLARLDLPPGTIVSGMEANGDDRFYCGGGNSGKIRALRRPESVGR